MLLCLSKSSFSRMVGFSYYISYSFFAPIPLIPYVFFFLLFHINWKFLPLRYLIILRDECRISRHFPDKENDFPAYPERLLRIRKIKRWACKSRHHYKYTQSYFPSLYNLEIPPRPDPIQDEKGGLDIVPATQFCKNTSARKTSTSTEINGEPLLVVYAPVRE